MKNCENWINLALGDFYTKVTCPKCNGKGEYRDVTIFDYSERQSYYACHTPQIIPWDGTEEQIKKYQKQDEYEVRDRILKCDFCKTHGKAYKPEKEKEEGYPFVAFFENFYIDDKKYEMLLFHKVEFTLTNDEFEKLEHYYADTIEGNPIATAKTYITSNNLHEEFGFVKIKLLDVLKEKRDDIYKTLEKIFNDKKYKINVSYIFDIDKYGKTYNWYTLNGEVIKG